MKDKAVFLDRDGTIIVDPPDERVDNEAKIELFPDSIEALKLLATLDYQVFIITNQAGIGEGRITAQDFERINNKVIELFKPSGIKIVQTYMCPHVPEDNCICRKPKPTMLLWAARDHNIDLENSWMIGDHSSDIAAGKAAGTKTILVQTANIPEGPVDATFTAKDSLSAIRYVKDN